MWHYFSWWSTLIYKSHIQGTCQLHTQLKHISDCIFHTIRARAAHVSSWCACVCAASLYLYYISWNMSCKTMVYIPGCVPSVNHTLHETKLPPQDINKPASWLPAPLTAVERVTCADDSGCVLLTWGGEGFWTGFVGTVAVTFDLK
jgi:hypothetical protein